MPSDRKPLLFVSSTSDLVEERAAVGEAISAKSIEIYRYEEDPGRGQSAKNRLLKKLKSTDVFVGIFGTSYGSPYPGVEFDGSIVEWEFETAMKQKRTVVLAFSNAHEAQDVDRLQEKFLARVGDFTRGVWLKNFESVDQFKVELRDAVQEWMLQYWSRYSQAQFTVSRIGMSALAVLLGTSLFGIGAAVFAGALAIKTALLLVLVAALGGTCGILIANR